MITVPKSAKLLELSHVDPLSLGKILGVIYGIIGFVYGLVLAVFLPHYFPMGLFGMMAGFGILIVIVSIVMFAVMGLLIGIIGSWIYNFVAGSIGGIKIKLR